MIVGCKKTLVEYRGLVNRNRYYLRNHIRMGGLFSRNDFVQRLTRPEYFPIATSPKTPPHRHSSNSPYPNPQSHHTLPHPKSPQKFPLPLNLQPKILPNSPNLTHTPSTIPPFIYTFYKNPQNSPKIPLNQTKNSSFIPKFLKNQQNSHQKITPIFPTSHIYTSKQLQKHLSKNLTNSPI